MIIRNFKKTDFEEILKWWKMADEPVPLLEMMPEESTFVIEENGKLMASITVYLTNSKVVAYLENFVRNPIYNNKHEELQKLINHAEKYTKEQGYKNLICLAYKDKLKERYQKYGYKKTIDNLTGFIREL